jgi:hypothetical protein
MAKSTDEIQQLIESTVQLGETLQSSAYKMLSFAIEASASLSKLSGATDKEREEIARLYSELEKGKAKIVALGEEYREMYLVSKSYYTVASRIASNQSKMSGPTAAFKLLGEQYQKLKFYDSLLLKIIDEQEQVKPQASVSQETSTVEAPQVSEEMLKEDLRWVTELSEKMADAANKAIALGQDIQQAMSEGGTDTAKARAQVSGMVSEFNKANSEFTKVESKFSRAKSQLVQTMNAFKERGGFIPDSDVAGLDQVIDRMHGLKETLSSIQSSISSAQKASPDLKGKSGNDSIAKKNKQAQQELNMVFSEQNQILQENRARLAEDQKYMRLQAQAANAAEGSVDQMNAQMKLLQMELAAINPNTEGAAVAMETLKTQINQLDLEIKKASPSTQKHVVDITEFGEATAFIASDIRKGIQALTQLKMQMQQQDLTTEEGRKKWAEFAEAYRKAMEEVGEAKRNYNQIKVMTNAFGNQAGALDSVLNATTAMVSGTQTYMGLVTLVGGATSDWGQALVKLQAIQAVVNGLTMTYNSLLKSSHFLTAIQTRLTKTLTGVMAALGTTSVWVGRAINAAFAAGPLIILVAALAAVAKLIKSITKLTETRNAFAKVMALNMESQVEAYKAREKYENASLERTLEVNQQFKGLYAMEGEYYEKAYQDQKLLLESSEQILKNAQETAKQEFPEINWVASTTKDSKKFTEEMLQQNIQLKIMEAELATLGLQLDDFKGQKDLEGGDFKIKFEGRNKKLDEVIGIVEKKLSTMKNRYDIFLDLNTRQINWFFDWKKNERQHEIDIQEERRRTNEETHKANLAGLANIQQRFNKEKALARERAQSAIDQLEWQKKLNMEMGAEERTQIDRQIAAERTALALELREIREQEDAANLKAIRDGVDAEYEAQVDSHQKRLNLLKLEHERELEDIDIRLATDQTLTETEQRELLRLKDAYEDRYIKDKKELERELMQELIEAERSRYEVREEASRENTQEALRYQKLALEKEMEAEILALQDLTEEERAHAATEYEIRLKYARAIAKAEMDLNNTVATSSLTAKQRADKAIFNARKHSIYANARFERQQAIEILQLEKQKLADELKMEMKLLGLKMLSGEISLEQYDEEVKALEPLVTLINAIDQEILNLGNQPVEASNIWELLGFDKDKASAMSAFADSIISDIQRVADAWIEYYEARTEAAENALEKAKTEYETQQQLRREGYANSVETARKEMLEKKKLRDQAIRQQREAERIQEALNTAQEASELALAVAKVYAQFGMPYGVIMAGIMIDSFKVSKIVAQIAARAKANVETYGEGTVELLQGGSHASGNDISLGYTKDGKERRAEGGEFFAVINKRNSRRYSSVIPDVINSLNDGSFGRKYQSTFDKTQGLLAIASEGNSVNLSTLEDGVDAIRQQGERKVYVDGQGNLVEVYKGITRKTIRR